MSENPKSAQRRAHNRRAISSLCKVCGTVHTANALGRAGSASHIWQPYRVVEPDELGVFSERRFYDHNGSPVKPPYQWRLATADEILDKLDSQNATMIVLGAGGQHHIFA